MSTKIALVFAALILLAVAAHAVPQPPTDIKAEFVGFRSLKVSWQHPGGAGVSFKLYKGPSVEEASLLATVSKKEFIDKDIAGGETYVYFVTAADSTGESHALQAVSVKPTVLPEKPFTISLVSPEKATFYAGEEISFIVTVESQFFEELENPEAVLLNTDFGINQAMLFDSAEKTFLLSLPVPELPEDKPVQTTYRVSVTASVSGEQFTESGSYAITLVPTPTGPGFDFWGFLQGSWAVISIPLLLALVLLVAGFVVWRWSLKQKVKEDKTRLEFITVLWERALWKYDRLKKKVSSQEFAERERELQEKQTVLEKKLRFKEKGIEVSVNPFAGFNRKQMLEVGDLIKSMGPQKREMSKEQMLGWLVDRGTSKKVAKKAVEMIYEK